MGEVITKILIMDTKQAAKLEIRQNLLLKSTLGPQVYQLKMSSYRLTQQVYLIGLLKKHVCQTNKTVHNAIKRKGKLNHLGIVIYCMRKNNCLNFRGHVDRSCVAKTTTWKYPPRSGLRNVRLAVIESLQNIYAINVRDCLQF